MSPSTHNILPNVLRCEYVVLNIDDGFMSLMLPSGDTKDDVKVPEGELGDQIKQMFDDGKEIVVTVIKALNEEGRHFRKGSAQINLNSSLALYLVNTSQV